MPELTEALKRQSVFANETGQIDGMRRHLGPDPAVIPPGTPLWMTRCGIGWEDRRWYHVMAGTENGTTPWCDECVAQAGMTLAARSDDLYELAVREWIARRIRGRGHQCTADDVLDVQFGIDDGYGGSDVTPPDEPATAISCMLSRGTQCHRHEESIPSPARLVIECARIVEELRLQPV